MKLSKETAWRVSDFQWVGSVKISGRSENGYYSSKNPYSIDSFTPGRETLPTVFRLQSIENKAQQIFNLLYFFFNLLYIIDSVHGWEGRIKAPSTPYPKHHHQNRSQRIFYLSKGDMVLKNMSRNTGFKKKKKKY